MKSHLYSKKMRVGNSTPIVAQYDKPQDLQQTELVYRNHVHALQSDRARVNQVQRSTTSTTSATASTTQFVQKQMNRHSNDPVTAASPPSPPPSPPNFPVTKRSKTKVAQPLPQPETSIWEQIRTTTALTAGMWTLAGGLIGVALGGPVGATIGITAGLVFGAAVGFVGSVIRHWYLGNFDDTRSQGNSSIDLTDDSTKQQCNQRPVPATRSRVMSAPVSGSSSLWQKKRDMHANLRRIDSSEQVQKRLTI